MKKLKNILFNTNLSQYALDFIESSKMDEYDVIDYNHRLISIMQSDYYMDQVNHNTNELGFCESYPLLENEPMTDLVKALSAINSKRKSSRVFSNKNLNLTELSSLLKVSYSIVDKIPHTLPPRRNIPSGGGLYPVDVYIINRKVEGLKKGVFYYNLSNASLDLLSKPDSPFDLEEKINNAFFIDNKADMDYENASAYIILAGILNRACFKYLDRGLRFSLMDAGAITQSIYLACSALNIGCCAIGGYADNLVNRLIDLKGCSQTVLGAVLIGKLNSEK